VTSNVGSGMKIETGGCGLGRVDEPSERASGDIYDRSGGRVDQTLTAPQLHAQSQSQSQTLGDHRRRHRASRDRPPDGGDDVEGLNA
jgi:hypothetical protein